MKILLINAELGYRGTPRTLANYARILGKNNELLIWGYDRGGETADALQREGFRVVIGEEGKTSALEFNPDIVNMHRASMCIPKETAILREFKSRGAKCVETSVFGRVDSSVEDILDLSLQISKWDLFRWNAWKGNYKVPGYLLPNPVNTDLFVRSTDDAIRDKRKSWGIIGEKDFALGRIGKTEWKSLTKPLLDLLVRNPNVHFVHVDDYGGSNIPPALKVHPRVHIQERMQGSEELSGFYSACDVCISMSGNGESFGFVNAEAMCCGTPVIALSTPLHDNAQIEMVEHEMSGIVIGRPSLLSVAVEKLMSDHAFYDRLAKNCRPAIVDKYSFKALSPVLNKCFDSVLAGEQELLKCEVADKISSYRRLKNVEGGCPLWQNIFAMFLYTKIGYRILQWAKCLKRQ